MPAIRAAFDWWPLDWRFFHPGGFRHLRPGMGPECSAIRNHMRLITIPRKIGRSDCVPPAFPCLYLFRRACRSSPFPALAGNGRQSSNSRAHVALFFQTCQDRACPGHAPLAPILLHSINQPRPVMTGQALCK
ncbi:hypothetical protein DMR_14720 [Solidesulfovibrio magneticus RS-1]|uniref:Uncharacterized protein n=1 Tax=Solidesulfovibrio magneticus (strain ATCC 700980 / DSM 13731 / RS-1) TaxID=573370 RepID=C4XNI8_SOLM1|nr:hypothetical protein DMR_14720 [Solidesulfovibrio magneticus RS-1]